MNTDPSSEQEEKHQILHHFEQVHKDELQAVLQVPGKITSCTPEEIMLHLHAMLEHLVPHTTQHSSEERVRVFHEWVESHCDLNLPHFSDEEISRESIYGERG